AETKWPESVASPVRGTTTPFLFGTPLLDTVLGVIQESTGGGSSRWHASGHATGRTATGVMTSTRNTNLSATRGATASESAASPWAMSLTLSRSLTVTSCWADE